MRIEDLDTPRTKAGAGDAILETLRWAGIQWDDPVLIQSADLTPHRQAMHCLVRRHLAYPCALSRSEVDRAASAPHADECEICFRPELRPVEIPSDFEDEMSNWRMVVPDQSIIIDDRFWGRVTFRPLDECGDFVIWTRRGQPAYQLAVVVDDARQGVTEVVRGSDLLPSAARQVLLHRALDLSIPNYTHIPLVVGPDGRRLAKRHGDTRIQSYRAAGMTRERLIGLVGYWSGVTTRRVSLSLADFVAGFDLNMVPRAPVTMCQEDDAWLRYG